MDKSSGYYFYSITKRRNIMRYFIMFFAITGVLFWALWLIGCVTVTISGKTYTSPLLKKEK